MAFRALARGACALRRASAAAHHSVAAAAPVARRGLLSGGVVAGLSAAWLGSSRSVAVAAFGSGPIPAPVDVAAPPANATVTASGLASVVLTPGSGSGAPGPTDKVTVDYTGWTTDGKMFDSSVVRGQNITFGLNQVIAGWTEGLQLMTPGETRRLWIPEALAYKGSRGKPAGTLVFDVTLYSVQSAPKPPAVPADVAAPPPSATTTASGLSYAVLIAGPEASARPAAASLVTVHYSGWTADGQLFDSSRTGRGEPVSFPLNQVIPGWTEGLQLQEVGSTYRFWIPAALAYGVSPPRGAPAGQLCFDVELLSFR